MPLDLTPSNAKFVNNQLWKSTLEHHMFLFKIYQSGVLYYSIEKEENKTHKTARLVRLWINRPDTKTTGHKPVALNKGLLHVYISPSTIVFRKMPDWWGLRLWTLLVIVKDQSSQWCISTYAQNNIPVKIWTQLVVEVAR